MERPHLRDLRAHPLLAAGMRLRLAGRMGGTCDIEDDEGVIDRADVRLGGAGAAFRIRLRDGRMRLTLDDGLPETAGRGLAGRRIGEIVDLPREAGDAWRRLAVLDVHRDDEGFTLEIEGAPPERIGEGRGEKTTC